MTWKRLHRKTLVDTPFLQVFADTVELPNGDVIDDYTVTKKHDFVMIVATDTTGKLITTREYRYAVDETLNNLPAGVVDKDETPLQAAKRELAEETGYSSTEWETFDTVFYDYATKDYHKVFFVRAKNARKTGEMQPETTESIEVRIISVDQLKREVKAGEWKTNVVLSALVMAGIYS